MNGVTNSPDTLTLWIVIVGLAVGSFLLRFVFLGIVGSRPMPPWVLRHLRYTAVAILPALVTPAVLWPAATGGAFDVPRMAAALATVAAGLVTRNVVFAIVAGVATLYPLLWLLA